MRLTQIAFSICFIFICIAYTDGQDTAYKRRVVINVKEGDPICGSFILADTDVVKVDVEGIQRTIRLDEVINIVFLIGRSQVGRATKGEINIKRLSPTVSFVQLKRMFVVPNLEGELEMAIFSAYNEQRPSGPERAEIHLFSAAYEERFNREARLTLLINGEQLTLGEMTKTETRNVCGIYNEHTLIDLQTNTLLRIANAKRLQIQVDSIKFELTEEQISMVRELLRLMGI